MSTAQRRAGRRAWTRFWWIAVLMTGFSGQAASATVLGNPVDGDPEFFLDDPRLAKLSERAGDYRVRFTGIDTSRFRNGLGGILGVTAEVTFHRVGAGDLLPSAGGGGNGDGPVATFARSLLVFTSVRLGTAPAGGLRCPSSSDLSLANAGFVFDGFGGDLSGPAVRVGDSVNGKVCDTEGNVFVAVPLDGTQDEPQRVDFQIQLGGVQPSLAFFFQYQGYSVVPEPAAGALVFAGIGVLAAIRRRRLRLN